MKRRLLPKAAAIVLALIVPGVALATQYSHVIWLGSYWDPVHGIEYSCGKAGIVDTAVNYNNSMSRTSESCATGKALPAYHLGSAVYGYKDGGYCGHSAIYYNDVTTTGWQLWQQVCSNPSGQQWFKTTGRSYIQYQSTWVYGTVESPSDDY